MREGVFRHPGNVRLKGDEKTLCGNLVKNNLRNEGAEGVLTGDGKERTITRNFQTPFYVRRQAFMNTRHIFPSRISDFFFSCDRWYYYADGPISHENRSARSGSVIGVL